MELGLGLLAMIARMSKADFDRLSDCGRDLLEPGIEHGLGHRIIAGGGPSCGMIASWLSGRFQASPMTLSRSAAFFRFKSEVARHGRSGASAAR